MAAIMTQYQKNLNFIFSLEAISDWGANGHKHHVGDGRGCNVSRRTGATPAICSPFPLQRGAAPLLEADIEEVVLSAEALTGVTEVRIMVMDIVYRLIGYIAQSFYLQRNLWNLGLNCLNLARKSVFKIYGFSMK